MKHLKVLIILAYILIGFYFAMNWLPNIVVWTLPFILAYFAAALTQPLRKFLIKKCKFHPSAAKYTAWAIAIVIFLGFFTLLIVKIISGIIDFANNQKLLNDMYNGIYGLYQRFMDWKATLPDNYSAILDDSIGRATSTVLSLVGQIGTIALTWARNMLAGFPNFLLFWLIFLIATFFFCKDYKEIKDEFARQVPSKWQKKVDQIKQFSFEAVGKYLRGMGIMLVVVFCILFIGLSILGVKYAVFIAAGLACLDVLPLIGTGIFLNPWGVYMIVFGHNFYVGFGLMILYLINIVLRNIIEPKVMSKSMGIHPLVTLLAVYVGLKTIGFAGVILFPILALVLLHLQEAGMFTLWRTKRKLAKKEDV